MPNWCSTSIVIKHDDKDKLKKLHDLICEFTSRNYAMNGFGNRWLGNIVLGAEIGTVDTLEPSCLRCRGSLEGIQLYDSELILNTETAWAPMLGMWVKLLEKYLPDAEIEYVAEELGCGIYCTNDHHMDGKYYFDCWDITGHDIEYELTEDGLRHELKDILNTDEDDINKLIEMFGDSEFADRGCIHEWEYCPVDRWY